MSNEIADVVAEDEQIIFTNRDGKIIFGVTYYEPDCCASTSRTYKLNDEYLDYCEFKRFVGSKYLGRTEEDTEYDNYTIISKYEIKIDDDIISIRIEQRNNEGCCGYAGFDFDGD